MRTTPHAGAEVHMLRFPLRDMSETSSTRTRSFTLEAPAGHRLPSTSQDRTTKVRLRVIPHPEIPIQKGSFMSQVLSRTSSKRYAATVVAGGLLFAGLTACASSKSTTAAGSTGGNPAPAAGGCPALGAVPASAPATTKGHVSVYSADGLMNTTD